MTGEDQEGRGWREELRSNPGLGIIRASWIGTGVFTVVAIAATLAPEQLGIVAAVVSLALFFVGTGAFLWAYGVAISRSRTDAIGIGGLFFLQGSAPAVIQHVLMTALAVEVVVALATASIRLYSALAFGILVPMYGLGLAGLWGARHGTFGPREQGRGTDAGT